MSDKLFNAEKRKYHEGGFSVSLTGGKELIKRLKKLENGGEVAIKRTVSDFSSRAPGWISKGVRQHYGVDTDALKDAGPKIKRGGTSIKAPGGSVDGVKLIYRGYTLTPLHFKMSPEKRPTGKKYKVKATIIKGKRKALPPGTFLATVRHDKNGQTGVPGQVTASTSKGRADDAPGPTLPFQRKGRAHLPIEVVRTLSVPQMTGGVDADDNEHQSLAYESVRNNLDRGLSKRFEHHIKQAMK